MCTARCRWNSLSLVLTMLILLVDGILMVAKDMPEDRRGLFSLRFQQNQQLMVKSLYPILLMNCEYQYGVIPAPFTMRQFMCTVPPPSPKLMISTNLSLFGCNHPGEEHWMTQIVILKEGFPSSSAASNCLDSWFCCWSNLGAVCRGRNI